MGTADHVTPDVLRLKQDGCYVAPHLSERRRRLPASVNKCISIRSLNCPRQEQLCSWPVGSARPRYDEWISSVCLLTASLWLYFWLKSELFEFVCRTSTTTQSQLTRLFSAHCIPHTLVNGRGFKVCWLNDCVHPEGKLKCPSKWLTYKRSLVPACSWFRLRKSKTSCSWGRRMVRRFPAETLVDWTICQRYCRFMSFKESKVHNKNIKTGQAMKDFHVLIKKALWLQNQLEN